MGVTSEAAASRASTFMLELKPNRHNEHDDKFHERSPILTQSVVICFVLKIHGNCPILIFSFWCPFHPWPPELISIVSYWLTHVDYNISYHRDQGEQKFTTKFGGMSQIVSYQVFLIHAFCQNDQGMCLLPQQPMKRISGYHSVDQDHHEIWFWAHRE